MRRLAVAFASLLVLTLASGCAEAPQREGPVGDDVSLPLEAAVPPPPDALSFAAQGCEQAALLAPIAADKAAALLPDGFEVYRDDAGLAWFGVSFTGCDAYTVAGQTHQRAIDVAETGIIIASPDGTGGVHVYRLVGTTDAAPIGRHLAALGAVGGHLDATRYAAESVLVSGSHVGEAPWPGLGFGLEAASGAAITPMAALEGITWWSQTEGGVLRIGYSYSELVAAPAQGTVKVESGSPFQDALEDTTADAGGFLFTHRLDAVAELVTLA